VNPPHEPGYLKDGGSAFYRSERIVSCSFNGCGKKFSSISPNAKYCPKCRVEQKLTRERDNKRIVARRRRKTLGLD